MPEVEVFPGYTVEKLEEKEDICFAYCVIGLRKKFWLMRNKPNPSMLFVCPEGRNSGKICQSVVIRTDPARFHLLLFYNSPHFVWK